MEECEIFKKILYDYLMVKIGIYLFYNKIYGKVVDCFYC